jgi:hypothetical protein
MLPIINGCTHSMSIKAMSAPISESRAQLVIDGKTTKTDILTMFGNPNGFIQGMQGQQGYDARSAYLNQNQSQNIMHYKDCIIKSNSKVGFMGFASSSGTGRFICNVFTALLNNKDIVVAHSYIEDNQITNDKLSAIIPHKSTRKNVIQQLGGPSSITITKNDEIYIYKDCLTQSQQRGMLGMFRGKELMSTNENCQQTSIVLNKKTGTVNKVSFYPYLESK